MKEKKKDRDVTSQQFIETLGVFDKDNAGKVSSGELRHVLTALGKRLGTTATTSSPGLFPF